VKKRFSDEQIVTILREVDTHGKSIEDTCKRHNISVQAFYLWRRLFGSLQENEVKRFREMGKENARLKRLLAERDLELDVVREFLKKITGAAKEAESGWISDYQGPFGPQIVFHPADQPKLLGIPCPQGRLRAGTETQGTGGQKPLPWLPHAARFATSGRLAGEPE
jgi:putative transposase